jgi:glycine hydroxymethyltransferase
MKRQADQTETQKRQRKDPSLHEADPDLHRLIELEKGRQQQGLEMIASENFTSRAVMECLGSCLTNKYAEGEVGARYYGGNEFVDQIEALTKERALNAFSLNGEDWAVNVQPYSGSPANFAVYTALLQPHDRILGLDLPSGGHLTHGYSTPTKKLSATSVYFECLHYHVTEDGLIDYDEMERLAQLFRPKLIIAGFSAYPRELDYIRFRKAADSVGALLMADIAHISGLVAAGEANNPFQLCDVVTTTTHKSLRGPRSGMIFVRKRLGDGKATGWPEKVNMGVFPGLQGGPHVHQIAAVCTQLKEVVTPEFKQYAKQVKANARALAEALIKLGYKMMSGGTDNHLVLWDLRPSGLTGSKMEKILEHVSISVNKNAIAGDKSALSPSGIRIGTPALTSRGLVEADFIHIAGFLDRAVRLATEIQEKVGKQLKAFTEALPSHEGVKQLRSEVEEFASQFFMPGI